MSSINPSLLCDFLQYFSSKMLAEGLCIFTLSTIIGSLFFLAMLPIRFPANVKPLEETHPKSYHQLSMHKTVAEARKRPSGTKGGNPAVIASHAQASRAGSCCQQWWPLCNTTSAQQQSQGEKTNKRKKTSPKKPLPYSWKHSFPFPWTYKEEGILFSLLKGETRTYF